MKCWKKTTVCILSLSRTRKASVLHLKIEDTLCQWCVSSCMTLNHNQLWTLEGFYYVKQYIHKPLWKSCECLNGKRQWTGEPVWMRSCQFCYWIPLTVLCIVLKRNSQRYMLNGLMHFQNDTKTGCLCVHSVSSSVATLSSESKPKDCDIVRLIVWYINMSLVFPATVEALVCICMCFEMIASC